LILLFIFAPSMNSIVMTLSDEYYLK